MARRFKKEEGFTNVSLSATGAQPSCDDKGCRFEFTAWGKVTGLGPGPTTMAHLRVDARSGSVLFQPSNFTPADGGPDDVDKWWKPGAYAKFLEDEDKAINAVTSMRVVKRMCAWIARHGRPCAVHLDGYDYPPLTCPASPGLQDQCLWAVWIGEDDSDHYTYWATALVMPGKWNVVGGETQGPPVPLGAFKKNLLHKFSGSP